MAVLDDKGLQKVLDKIKNAANGCYTGIDLTVKFASEINATSSSVSPYYANGDCWEWIRKRISAGNFDGIMIGDYIPFEMTNAESGNIMTFRARVGGINTYKGMYEGNGLMYDPDVDNDVAAGNSSDHTKQQITGSYNSWTRTPNHIDFICRECWGFDDFEWWENYLEWDDGTDSGEDYSNNGMPNRIYPYLCSSIYRVLNSAYETTDRYTGGDDEYSVWYAIQNEVPNLANVISYKYLNLEQKYRSNSAGDGSPNNGKYPFLQYPTGTGWSVNIGKIWVPSEVEMFGRTILSMEDIDRGNHRQYPIFQMGWQESFFKNYDDSQSTDEEATNYAYPWLLNTVSGSYYDAVDISDVGYVGSDGIDDDVSLPLCFRVASE